MNPILMEDILDDLYYKMSIEDLKTGRSVCKLWNKRIVAHLKKNWKDVKEVDLGSEQEIVNFNKVMFQSQDDKLYQKFSTNFCLMMALGKNFCTKYQPKYLQLSLKSRNSIKIENLIEILALIAPFVEELIITGFAYFARPSKPQDKWLDFQFPKLEIMNSNFTCGPSPIDLLIIGSGLNFIEITALNDGLVIQLIQEIYENSPNLKSIENQVLPKFPTFHPKSMSSGILEHLSKLHIRYIQDTRFGQNHPNELVQMQNHGLKLKHLNIRYQTICCNPETLQNDLTVIENFLEGQSNSLETLKLTIQDNCLIKMPVFPQVRKLSFGVCNYNSTDSPIDLKKFPELETITLMVESKIFGNWDKIFCESAPKVHTVKIINNNHYGPKEDYLELEPFFPKIENLEIGIGYKNGTSYEPCRTGWKNSLKSIKISIWDLMKKKHPTNLSIFPQQTLTLHLKILKNFKELQKIELANVVSKEYGSPHWCIDFKTLKSLENVKYVKLNNFKVSKKNLTELRNNYILDYNPGKSKFLYFR